MTQYGKLVMRCCSHQALPSCVVPFLSPVWALHALMRWCLGVAACRGTAVPVLLRYQSGLWSPRAGCSKRDFTAWWKEITSQWTSAGIGCGLLIFRGRLIPKTSCAVSTDAGSSVTAIRAGTYCRICYHLLRFGRNHISMYLQNLWAPDTLP